MSLQYESDKIRYKKIKTALNVLSNQPYKEPKEDDLLAADDLTLVTSVQEKPDVITVYYDELWNEDCFNSLFLKPEYKNLKDNPLEAIEKFFDERFIEIADSLNLDVLEHDVKGTSYDDEAILHVVMVHSPSEKAVDEILSEVDYYGGRQGGSPMVSSKPLPDTQRQDLPQGGQQVVPINAPSAQDKFNRVYMTRQKSQDPKVVDRLLKTVFDAKFNPKYSLSSDIGEWHPTKTLSTQEGKLYVMWEHDKTNKVKIATTFFPKESNIIQVQVMDRANKMLIETYFEIYRIPTDAFLVERFLRKVYFSVMKKFLNSQVIKLEPFKRSFVFWKSHNPYFSYSFSEPKKNQIILDLISFIKTNKRPILDDFFEQNNLRHKQGYLQTLLDAAEDAAIFSFYRQGNEVLIQRGTNFKAFLEGRIRKS